LRQRLVQVVVVVDGDGDIQAPRNVAAVVGDGGVPHHAVGQRNINAVDLHQAAQEQADFDHGAFGAAAQGHVFARAQGTQDQQHDAGGDVLQGVLQGQAHGQAGSA